MPSPFPGMAPYLEGYLWADVHQALAYQFRRQLAPLVVPDYAVRLAVTMLHDRVPAHELGIMYPDVEIIRPKRDAYQHEPGEPTQIAVAPAPMRVSLPLAVTVRIVTVEIRDVAKNQLVTSIEILSPANKREPGLRDYLAKRDELQAAGVHLLEIDLIRRGTRSWSLEQVPSSAYLATLIRAAHTHAEVWPIGLRDRLPTLPVPLRAPDADVPLDMQAALTTIYDEANYALPLNYHEPSPNPPLASEDAAWVAHGIRQWEEVLPW